MLEVVEIGGRVVSVSGSGSAVRRYCEEHGIDQGPEPDFSKATTFTLAPGESLSVSQKRGERMRITHHRNRHPVRAAALAVSVLALGLFSGPSVPGKTPTPVLVKR